MILPQSSAVFDVRWASRSDWNPRAFPRKLYTLGSRRLRVAGRGPPTNRTPPTRVPRAGGAADLPPHPRAFQSTTHSIAEFSCPGFDFSLSTGSNFSFGAIVVGEVQRCSLERFVVLKRRLLVFGVVG